MASEDNKNSNEVKPADALQEGQAAEAAEAAVSEAENKSTPNADAIEFEVDFEKLKKIVEGAIFSAAKPMTIDHLGNLFMEDVKPANEEFKAVLESLMEDYANRGVMLKQVSSGYRFQAVEEVAPWVSRMWEEKPARYSRALLETLALIAYRQPITRGEIEEIRGVSTSSHIMKTLQEREWVRVVGHRDVPGRPSMYATTRNFLDYFNLKNIDELPSLAEIRDLSEINRELDLAAGIAPETPEVESGAEESLDSQDQSDQVEDTLTEEMFAEGSDEEPEEKLAPQGNGQEETYDSTVEVLEEEADRSISGTNDQETEAETN